MALGAQVGLGAEAVAGLDPRPHLGRVDGRAGARTRRRGRRRPRSTGRCRWIASARPRSGSVHVDDLGAFLAQRLDRERRSPPPPALRRRQQLGRQAKAQPAHLRPRRRRLAPRHQVEDVEEERRRTSLASGPTASRLQASGTTPSAGTRPRVGRMPTTPQRAAGDADRAAGVAADRRRGQVARHRRGGPGARAAGQPRRVPGVAAVALVRVAPVDPAGELVGVALADDDRARGPQPRHHGRVASGWRTQSAPPAVVGIPATSTMSLTQIGIPASGCDGRGTAAVGRSGSRPRRARRRSTWQVRRSRHRVELLESGSSTVSTHSSPRSPSS